MKHLRLTVPWNGGLHLRPAAKVVRLAREFHSSICLKANGRIADARSIVSIMLLCASLGTPLDVEASGDDEDLAIDAVAGMFQSNDDSADASNDQRK